MVNASELERLPGDASRAVYAEENIYVNGSQSVAKIYDRGKLCSGDRIVGAAIVTEMDSTTLILPDHAGEIDRIGNILIRPVE